MKRIELNSGIALNMINTNRFKTGCFSFNLLQPLQEQTASVNALIPSVLLRGCRSYPDMQSISHRLDELYGATVGSLVRKRGEVQSIGLYADFLEDCYADNEPIFSQMMAFVRELLLEPCVDNGGFVPGYVSGEKQNLCNTIASRINDKRSYAISQLLKTMCRDEAYAVARLGEAEELEAVDCENLYRHWMYLLSVSPIEIFYLGQQPEEKVLAEVQKLINKLPLRDELVLASTKVVLPDRPVQTVVEELDVTQGKLSIGFRTPITAHDSRYPALMLFNAIFGGSMTSKLFTKIREEQSLCYYASSSLDRTKGIMIVNSGIEFDKFEIAKSGILKQLELCQNGDITEEEVSLAQNYLISNLRAYNDSPGQMDDFMTAQAIAGLTYTIEDLICRIEAVTTEQIVNAANTLILDTIYFLKGGVEQ